MEALDQYIDYDEHGQLRKCLLDKDGKRLRDKEGNLKTLRHKFAVYCDDIATGADTLEELFDLFEALLCCCARAGIQIKAAKVKFGVEKITFHNYTIAHLCRVLLGQYRTKVVFALRLFVMFPI